MNKRKLVELIYKNLYGKIHVMHINSVINILIDEMSKNLMKGKEIKIPNFGRFEVINLDGKKSINVRTGKKIITKPSKIIKFRLTRRLAKWISNRYYTSLYKKTNNS